MFHVRDETIAITIRSEHNECIVVGGVGTEGAVVVVVVVCGVASQGPKSMCEC